ncbi:MAG: spermidine synthase [Chthoniobacterales bacterium]
MSIAFEELDFQPTEMGDLILRRRRLQSLDGQEVYEVKLGDAFLMSSLFTRVEVALAEFGLAELPAGPLDVVVGGLGLGYTARAALAHPGVESVVVIDALAPVIDWHQRGLVPLGPELTSDSRCRFVLGDFFARVASDALDPSQPGKQFDAILLDIDHSPRDLLHPRHEAFYSEEGLRQLTKHLRPGGVFGMWSDDPPDDDFQAGLARVFADSRAHIVTFPNPLLDEDSASTVYVSRVAP